MSDRPRGERVEALFHAALERDPTRRSAFLALTLAACISAPERPATSGAPGVVSEGIRANDSGAYTLVGTSELDPRAALTDAMTQAHGFAAQREMDMVPKRIEPGRGRDAIGNEVYSCKLHFEVVAREASGPTRDGEEAAFEWRMRQLVEEGRLSIEAYERAMNAARSR